MLAVLALPVVCMAGFDHANWKIEDFFELCRTWQWWLWLALMGAAQLALLAVPVRFASRRPMTRRPLAITVVTSALMMGALGAGALCSLCEAIFGERSLADDTRLGAFSSWGPLILGLAGWIIWAWIFLRMSRASDTQDFIARQGKWLLKGSIAELLVAVPTHIVARSRDYCCAGIMTFIGLTLGLSVLLFSFGPGVFFLFVARWRQLHPEASRP